jgi:hypothetical protein
MKNLTVKTRVYKFINSIDYLLLNRKPKLDMRYNTSKEFMSLFYKLTKDFNKSEALEKLKARRKANSIVEFSNVLNNKLYVDFKKNKLNVRFINDTHINFYGRNHHAKNEIDLKVLSILKKNFKK